MGGGPGITDACRALCKSLLEAEQPLPADSIFQVQTSILQSNTSNTKQVSRFDCRDALDYPSNTAAFECTRNHAFKRPHQVKSLTVWRVEDCKIAIFYLWKRYLYAYFSCTIGV